MPSDPLIGRTIHEKYRLDAEIGAGGMATVYRATRLHIGDTVAIKVLHAELLREPKFAERFQREAQAAARLKHPNVVAVHDFGVCEDGLTYLVMELVEGRNLRAVIKEDGPMTAAAAAQIVRQVCAALTEAHRHNLVHRDIKPANIAIDRSAEEMRVKVLDFGIASLRGGTMMTFTQTGAVMGTPAYMSPEQCLGEELDGRSDIYSLGVVLFEMLCGVVPFNSPTATAVVMQHVQQAPPPLRVLNVSVSAVVEAVVLRALAKRREERFQTAREFADALTAAVAGASAPTYAGAPAAEPFAPGEAERTMMQSAFRAPAPPPPPPHHGGPARVAVGVGVIALLAAAGIGAQRLSARPPAPSPSAQPARAAASHAPATYAVAQAHPDVAPTGAALDSNPYRHSVEVVNEYYRLWNAGEYRAMYAMLSDRMQRKNPFDQYIKYHSLVSRIGVDAVPGFVPSVVNVRIVSHDREKDGSVTENYNEGRWFLTVERGALRLDAQDAHEVKPPTVVAASSLTPVPVDPAPVNAVRADPAPANPVAGASPVEFVREYYRLWNARDYATMYGMLSADMQRRHPYADYVKYHSNVLRIDAQVAPTYVPSIVNVRLISQDREVNGSVTQSVNEGQWYLTQENGQLKLENQRLHEVSS